MTERCVDALLEAITTADLAHCESYAPNAILDATVPGWRFARSGAEAILDEYSGWFAAPGHFENLRREPLPHGELVEYSLAWEEDGVPHAAHHMHVLDVAHGRIVRDTVMCGGRWPASLLAQMEAATSA